MSSMMTATGIATTKAIFPVLAMREQHGKVLWSITSAPLRTHNAKRSSRACYELLGRKWLYLAHKETKGSQLPIDLYTVSRSLSTLL